MKIGITAGCYTEELSAFEKEITELKEVGFDCIDYQGFINTQTPLFDRNDTDFEAYLRSQAKIVSKAGLSIHQVHGPWRWPSVDATKEGRTERFEKMSRSIRGTALLGCDRMVLHNVMPQGRIDTDPAYVRSVNADFFARLCEVAKQYGVTVCLENMPFPCQCLARPAQTLAFVGKLNHPNLKICLDTGHAQVLNVAPGDAVRLIGKELLYALHVHDNDGLRDRHWLIGDGVTDWQDFGKALHEIGFDGCFSIESAVSPKLSAAERRAVLERLYAEAKRLSEIGS